MAPILFILQLTQVSGTTIQTIQFCSLEAGQQWKVVPWGPAHQNTFEKVKI